MKNSPLSLQIWLVFVAVTLVISLLFMLLVPITLRDFFTQQTYASIREAQAIYLSNGRVAGIDDIAKWDQLSQQYRSINHVVLLENGTIISGSTPMIILENMNTFLSEATSQQLAAQQYSRKINDERMYYIIRKAELAGTSIFLFSYTWEAYQNDLINALYTQLMWIIAVILLFSWIPSFMLARYLSRPLINIENHVRRIADRDWFDTLEIDRNDEIGRLGQSIERMRQRLIEQDEMQRGFLQNISHELKTPVMVIRSYAQAIADGIFPKGGLEGSINVIDTEAERMEKRIKDLLYLTKIDYLFAHPNAETSINIGKLIEDVVEHMRWKRPELEWQLDIEDAIFTGVIEQWQVALENLVDNQIRYADNIISITVKEVYKENRQRVYIRVFNDGPPLDEELMDKLFEQYQQGYRGEFGLGLAIVHEIAAYHDAQVWAANEEKGVAFYLDIPVNE